LVKSSIFQERQLVSGGSASSTSGSGDWWMNQELAAHSFFPPEEVAEIKALACELPKERGIPLSRFSITEIV